MPETLERNIIQNFNSSFWCAKETFCTFSYQLYCSFLGRAFVRHPASALSLYNWGEALLGSVIHCTAQCRFKPSLHGITWQNIKKINDGMLLPIFTDQVWIHNAGSWILTKLQGHCKSEAAEKCRRSSQHRMYRKLYCWFLFLYHWPFLNHFPLSAQFCCLFWDVPQAIYCPPPTPLTTRSPSLWLT